MDANHILSRWERVRGTLKGNLKTWMVLLCAARAGEKGLSKKALILQANVQAVDPRHTFHLLSSAGLIRIVAALDTRNRPYTRIYITPQGLDVLGLQPVKEEATAV